MPLKIGQTVQLGLQPVVIDAPETDQPWGGPYDPKHAQYGETAEPYPYELYDSAHGPYGPSADYYGFDIAVAPAGQLQEDPTGDLQPVTHAAPWPKGVAQSVQPDPQAPGLTERADIHASNMGLSRAMRYDEPPENDTWTDFAFEDAGESLQAPVPGQIKAAGGGGYGNTDRAQSFARQNQYGFDSAHRHRRWATGSIPGNFDMLRPGSRPMVIRPQQSRIPNGPDSPFAGQDMGANFDTQGSVLTELPSEYMAPPEPAVNPAPLPANNDAPVDFY